METIAANWREDYDWREVFKYADPTVPPDDETPSHAFGIDDVDEVFAHVLGENDGDAWQMLGRLKDGRFFYIEASCDYTGWGCQEGGSSTVSLDREQLIRLGMPKEARRNLGVALADD